MLNPLVQTTVFSVVAQIDVWVQLLMYIGIRLSYLCTAGNYFLFQRQVVLWWRK